MSKKKKEEIIEAVLYFKNSRGATTVGVQSENETQLIYKSNGFTSVVEKRMLSCLVTDNGKAALKERSDRPISGFEVFTESGSALGFNGWKIEDKHFVTKQGELVEFYEPIIYIKLGPEDAAKNPPEPKREELKSEKKLICIKCGKVVLESDFKDKTSFTEFGISKLCQNCQDEIFDEDEDNQEEEIEDAEAKSKTGKKD